MHNGWEGNVLAKIVLIYSTTDGQTKKIIERIKVELAGSNVETAPISRANELELTAFDKVVLGASIRYGKHKPEVFDFVKKQKEILEGKETYFFSVNVVARKPNKNTPATNPYMKKFLEKTSWKPDFIEVFAGTVNYPKYNFLDRNIIRLIMYITKGPTNVSQCHEFTDWESVKKFGKLISKRL